MKAITFILLVLCKGPLAEQPQQIPRLPKPTGRFSVGRRILLAQRDGPSGQRLMEIGLWYPECDSDQSLPAPYLPVFPFDHSALARYLPNHTEFLTRAHENAKPCKKSTPLLLFSPGLGITTYAYSAQFEELASNGYTIAAVQHPGEGVELLLPKGKVIPATTAGGTVMQVNEKDVNTLLADLQKALEVVIAKRKSFGFQPFTKIGFFGHSIGGVVALRACQLDRRIAACLSDDGLYERRPFFSLPTSLRQPFLVLAESNPGLSDEMIASTHLTRAAFAAQEMEPRGTALEMYKASATAAYLVIVATPDVTHMSFTDFALLDRSKSPSGELSTFRVIVTTTEDFFDSYLREKSITVYDPRSTGDIAVFRFVHSPK